MPLFTDVPPLLPILEQKNDLSSATLQFLICSIVHDQYIPYFVKYFGNYLKLTKTQIDSFRPIFELCLIKMNNKLTSKELSRITTILLPELVKQNLLEFELPNYWNSVCSEADLQYIKVLYFMVYETMILVRYLSEITFFSKNLIASFQIFIGKSSGVHILMACLSLALNILTILGEQNEQFFIFALDLLEKYLPKVNMENENELFMMHLKNTTSKIKNENYSSTIEKRLSEFELHKTYDSKNK